MKGDRALGCTFFMNTDLPDSRPTKHETPKQLRLFPAPEFEYSEARNAQMAAASPAAVSSRLQLGSTSDTAPKTKPKWRSSHHNQSGPRRVPGHVLTERDAVDGVSVGRTRYQTQKCAAIIMAGQACHTSYTEASTTVYPLPPRNRTRRCPEKPANAHQQRHSLAVPDSIFPGRDLAPVRTTELTRPAIQGSE